MHIHIDLLRGGANPGKGGLLHCVRPANKGHDRPVVIRVAGGIKNVDGGSRPDRIDNGSDHLWVAAFAKIRNTFDECAHELSFPCKRSPAKQQFYSITSFAA